jgi:5-methylthioadenosine/S-adenosylhomocysteine deaminase
MRRVLRNGEVLCPDGRLRRADVVVEGGRIAAVVAPGDAGPGDGEDVDCSQRLITPGLVDGHTHLYQTLLRDRIANRPLADWLNRLAEWLPEPDELYDSVLMGSAEAIHCGTTCVSDMVEGAPLDSGRQVEAILDSGLRATVALMVGDVRETEMQHLLSTEAAIADTEAFVRSWHGASERLLVKLGPVGLPACSEELYRWCVEERERSGIGIHTHCAEGERETAGSLDRFGTPELATLASWDVLDERTSLAHAIWISDDEIETTARSGAYAVHCPSSNVRLGDGLARVTEMLDAGVRVAIGCDGAASSCGYDLLAEGRTAALLQKGRTGDPTVLPSHAVLRCLTEYGAGAAGWRDQIGAVAVGRSADLALWSLDRSPLMAAEHRLERLLSAGVGLDCTDSMVGGEWLMRAGCVVAFDEIALRDRVRRRWERSADAYRGRPLAS